MPESRLLVAEGTSEVPPVTGGGVDGEDATAHKTWRADPTPKPLIHRGLVTPSEDSLARRTRRRHRDTAARSLPSFLNAPVHSDETDPTRCPIFSSHQPSPDLSGRLPSLHVRGPNDVLTPRQLVAMLDQHVVGQAPAKKTLAVAVYNHYKRIQHSRELAAAASESEAARPGDGAP